MARQKELEREVELLKERLDAAQSGWAAVRSDLEDRERQAVACDVTQLQAFQRSVSQVLSEGGIVVEADDDHIIQRLHELLHSIRDKTLVSPINNYDWK